MGRFTMMKETIRFTYPMKMKYGLIQFQTEENFYGNHKTLGETHTSDKYPNVRLDKEGGASLNLSEFLYSLITYISRRI